MYCMNANLGKVVLLAVLLVFLLCPPYRPLRWSKVVWIVDGDTIILDNKEHVRLIGIDAPEKKEPYYRRATRFLIKLAKGKRVRLEFDRENRDKFGRLLAYVYL